MNRRRRHLLIEGLIAAVVIGLLLLVMIPRFQRAQVAGRATQALRDMASLVQAIEAYNLEFPGERYLADQERTVYDERISGLAIEQAMGAHRLIAPYTEWNEQTHRLMSLREERVRTQTGEAFQYVITYSRRIRNPPGFTDGLSLEGDQVNAPPAWLAERMDTVPTPPDAWHPLWRQPIASRYEIADLTRRHSIRRSLSAPGWTCFLVAEPATEWMGVYYGPFLHIDLHNLAYEDLYDFYVPYDPTNGVMSHGFTLYDSKQPLSAFSKFAYEKYQEMGPLRSPSSLYMPCLEER